MELWWEIACVIVEQRIATTNIVSTSDTDGSNIYEELGKVDDSEIATYQDIGDVYFIQIFFIIIYFDSMISSYVYIIYNIWHFCLGHKIYKYQS